MGYADRHNTSRQTVHWNVRILRAPSVGSCPNRVNSRVGSVAVFAD